MVDCSILDDTSVLHRPLARLKGPDANIESPTCISTIMNNVRKLHISYSDDTGEPRKSTIRLPCPSNVLREAKTADLHSSYCSTSFASCNGIWVGEFFKRLGIPSNLLQSVKWRSAIMVGDSLKANDSLFHVERTQLTLSRALRVQHMDKMCALQIRCMLHQACLILVPF